jgi:hypothetical protein
MWVCAPKTVVKNLVLVKDVPKEKFGLSRTVNLPGQTVKVSAILDALEQVGGKEARALVQEKRDAATEKIVLGWPYRFDIGRANSLGLAGDCSLREIVEDFAASLKQ